jgi:hypothetical protein
MTFSFSGQGGRDNGAPGLRPRYHANYYGAFILDPDGHNSKLSVTMHHERAPTAGRTNSETGTKPTCLGGLTTSVHRGKADLAVTSADFRK